MKTVDISHATLDVCVDSAQTERLVVTRDGNPIAVIVGVQGLDTDQIQLGTDDTFWKLIRQRRQEKTISRDVLERSLNDSDSCDSNGL